MKVAYRNVSGGFEKNRFDLLSEERKNPMFLMLMFSGKTITLALQGKIFNRGKF